MHVHGLLLGLLLGCGGDGAKTDGDADTDADTDSDTETGSDTGSETSSETGSDTDTGTGDPCPEVDSECDLVEGTGCAAGLRCGYWWALEGEGSPEVRCLDPGDVGIGDACDVVSLRCGGFANDCAQTAECLEPRDGAGPQCLHYCSGPGTCEDGSPCGTTIPWSELSVCVAGDACDPDDQSGCEEGEGCYMVTDGIAWTTQCIEFHAKSGSTGQTGAPCTFVENCAPGWQCVTWIEGSDPVCKPVCNTADDVCPPATGTCQVVVDLPDWGVCLQ